MANKKQQTSRSARAGGPPPQPQSQGPTPRVTAMLGTLRLVALMSATIVALLVFELLQPSFGFWPALGVGLAAGIVARAGFIWLERVWLRAAARKAQAREAGRADGPPRPGS